LVCRPNVRHQRRRAAPAAGCRCWKAGGTYSRAHSCASRACRRVEDLSVGGHDDLSCQPEAAVDGFAQVQGVDDRTAVERPPQESFRATPLEWPLDAKKARLCFAIPKRQHVTPSLRLIAPTLLTRPDVHTSHWSPGLPEPQE